MSKRRQYLVDINIFLILVKIKHPQHNRFTNFIKKFTFEEPGISVVEV